MPLRILLIDDLRVFPEVTATARTYAEGILLLREGAPWDELWLDHDLGEEKSGYDVMCWIEEHPELLPGSIRLVTANPVGRERMDLVIRKLYGLPI